MTRTLALGVAVLVLTGIAWAEETVTPTRWEGSREGLSFRFMARTPAQMAAFYEGRGVVRQAIDEIRKACFIGGVLVNKTQDIVWLDLSMWRFVDRDGKPINRYVRDSWHKIWARLDVPLANQSVFDWTQLPESRDLHPAESVGGNISLQPPAGSFALEAHFPLGAARDKGEIVVRISDLNCPREKS